MKNRMELEQLPRVETDFFAIFGLFLGFLKIQITAGR
jgi:hypothetical protein